MEVPLCHPEGRQHGGGVLFSSLDQSLSAGRHRHQDGAHRQKQPFSHHFQGHISRKVPECVQRTGPSAAHCCRIQELLPVRFYAHRRHSWGKHLPLYTGKLEHSSTFFPDQYQSRLTLVEGESPDVLQQHLTAITSPQIAAFKANWNMVSESRHAPLTSLQDLSWGMSNYLADFSTLKLIAILPMAMQMLRLSHPCVETPSA